MFKLVESEKTLGAWQMCEVVTVLLLTHSDDKVSLPSKVCWLGAEEIVTITAGKVAE